jgi:hypothetical protein
VYQGASAAVADRFAIEVARCTFFRIPYTWEELLLVSGTEALANEARLLNLVEQGHGIIFG